ncbi:hypothetical protein [Psychromarinibacter halotolerans]|uniref:Homeodomain-like domain-containing protein n=1 Tax=Psychromarinibacter halotolerans TaxID=1775175 RepID=A0ABV7GYH1_9RHOB|nr:hypothetical protein [Psychromarinibacter halotolerans]MDF0598970.1 hypothetical protein [Psychromarinibacter halotolerans]
MVEKTRDDDEILLRMLGMRCDGAASSAIGRAFGVTASRVRVMTDRVRHADVAESGEPADVVQAAYW